MLCAITQNKQSRAKDEKVGGLEPMFSGPQRNQQHPCCRHPQTRIEDDVGRPGIVIGWSKRIWQDTWPGEEKVFKVFNTLSSC